MQGPGVLHMCIELWGAAAAQTPTSFWGLPTLRPPVWGPQNEAGGLGGGSPLKFMHLCKIPGPYDGSIAKQGTN